MRALWREFTGAPSRGVGCIFFRAGDLFRWGLKLPDCHPTNGNWFCSPAVWLPSNGWELEDASADPVPFVPRRTRAGRMTLPWNVKPVARVSATVASAGTLASASADL